jgi:hypothetical protein
MGAAFFLEASMCLMDAKPDNVRFCKDPVMLHSV